MRYSITGGSGFIGRYFCEALAAAGHAVTILDLIDPVAGAPHARFVRGDVRDPAACRDAFAGCDRVLHLAAAHHDFGIERETFFDVNEHGAGVVCAALDAAGITEVCFYSTVATYGDTPEPHHEDSPTRPVSPYGQSKLAGEDVFRKWTQKGEGRRCLVIRPTVTFGPRNFANMYTLIDQIDRGRFLLVGKGDNIKSLSYVENIVEATLALMGRADLPAFEVINYIDKPDLTSMEIARTVYDALGKKPGMRVPYGLVRLLAVPFDVVIALTGRNLPISSARLRKLFLDQTKFEADRIHDRYGFVASVPLREGIRRMVKWYQAEGKHQKAEWHLPPKQAVMREEARPAPAKGEAARRAPSAKA